MEAIYAIDLKNGFAKDGKIPWHSKKDLKFFMDMTKNNIVMMGKKTYFSLPKGPLKDRLNIVLTSNPYNECCIESNVIFTSYENIYEHILTNRDKYLGSYSFLSPNFKIFIIGGKKIYEQFIPLCERVWVTIIKKNYSCDLFLDYNYSKEYKEELIEEDDELKIIKYEKI